MSVVALFTLVGVGMFTVAVTIAIIDYILDLDHRRK